MPKQWLQYPVVTIDPALLAREATLQQVRDNLTNGTQKSQRIDGSGNVSPAGDVPARGEYVRPTDGTNTQGYTATGEAKVSVTQPLPTGSNGIGSVSVSASALPTGASTSANQTNGTQQTQIVQGGNTALVSPSGGLLVAGLSAVGVAPASNPVSISGVDGGGLKRSFLTDNLGRIEINTVQGLPLPSGAATSANQSTSNATLSSIDGKTPALGQAVAAASTPVVLPAAQITALTPPSTVTVTQATGTNLHAVIDGSALPAGASTSANQTNGTQQTQIVQGGNTALVSTGGGLIVAGLSAAGVAPASNPVSISGVDGGGLKRNILTDTSGRVEINTAQSLPLPSGASTETTLAAISAKLPTSIGQKTSAASLGVVFASDQSALPAATRTPVGFVRNNYNTATGGTNVTSGAYVQLFASTSAATSLMEIFDSSGQTLKIAFGAAASEVDQFLVFPGGNGPIAVKVPVSTRVSIRAVTGSAVSGEIDINLYG